MELIGPIIFAVFMLVLGLIATTNPSGIMHFYKRLHKRSRLDEITKRWSIRLDETSSRWSIRSAGVIALLMAAIIFWAILHGGNR
jgi:hypothetical protein